MGCHSEGDEPAERLAKIIDLFVGRRPEIVLNGQKQKGLEGYIEEKLLADPKPPPPQAAVCAKRNTEILRFFTLETRDFQWEQMKPVPERILLRRMRPGRPVHISGLGGAYLR
ncbi:hypothetical protein QE152_g3478 [Popillia japonica]|uniref:Uncharacterized protein n=1 Tax=Popillia japonica TaxID=7064 RepID=A0AAW1N0L1_POPJA